MERHSDGLVTSDKAGRILPSSGVVLRANGVITKKGRYFVGGNLATTGLAEIDMMHFHLL